MSFYGCSRIARFHAKLDEADIDRYALEMGRPALGNERLTLRFSPATVERMRKLAPNYGLARFARDAVNRELDRLEREGTGATEVALADNVVSDKSAAARPADSPKEPVLAVPAAPVGSIASDEATRAAWRSMRQNSRGTGYPIATEWNDVRAFITDLGLRPNRAILVRRNEKQGWSSENCFWGSKADVCRLRSSNTFHTINGETKTVAEWARSYGRNRNTVVLRMKKYGLSLEEALLRPVRPVPSAKRLTTARRSRKNRMPERKKDPRYKAWKGMRQRCKPGGDTYVPAWEDFWVFCRDIGERPPGTVQMRHDDSKPYGPGNSFWGTKGEVSRARSFARRYLHGGRVMTVSEIAQAAGLKYETVSARLTKGWPLEKALCPVVRPRPGSARR